MEKYIEILSRTALFSGLDRSDIKEILKIPTLKTVTYNTDETVFMAGTYARYIGIVLSGQVRIIREDFYGNRDILAYINTGEIFGEAFACAESEFLPITATASQLSEVLLIEFKQLIDHALPMTATRYKLMSNMLRIMASKNLLLNQKIEFLSKRSTKEKLLAYLSAQAEKAGSSSFSIPLNRQELADFLSVDRSAMSAQLCKLRDSGVLDFYKNHFTLK